MITLISDTLMMGENSSNGCFHNGLFSIENYPDFRFEILSTPKDPPHVRWAPLKVGLSI